MSATLQKWIEERGPRGRQHFRAVVEWDDNGHFGPWRLIRSEAMRDLGRIINEMDAADNERSAGCGE